MKYIVKFSESKIPTMYNDDKMDIDIQSLKDILLDLKDLNYYVSVNYTPTKFKGIYVNIQITNKDLDHKRNFIDIRDCLLRIRDYMEQDYEIKTGLEIYKLLDTQIPKITNSPSINRNGFILLVFEKK